MLGKGFGIAAALYAVIAGYLLVMANDTRVMREEKLATKTVEIERSIAEEQESESAEVYGPVAPAEPETAIAEPAALPEDTHAVTEEPVTETTPEETTGLPPAPLEGLYEDTVEGRLPKVREEDKLAPFHAYKRPFSPTPGAKLISVALVDIGISESSAAEAMTNMPVNVTMVVSPYAVKADHWLDEARAKGYETWLTLPVETELYPFNDPGPQTLLINAAERLNRNKLYWALSRGSGYAGVVTEPDATFFDSPVDAKPVLNEVFTRGLGFINGDTSPSETSTKSAREHRGAYEAADVWIDVPSSPEHIAASFRQLEVLADGEGKSIGFVHATPQNLKLLKTWLESLPGKGFLLAPLSAQTNTPGPS